ncbi:cytochrome PufQ [Oceanibium sediminis]|uniref:cytochrome PufQ n=1 Tax=Oceanibium sediminis TaxID=2026339 RepID=UPI000DD3467C|nr:cytochrome PufQ [Oceanibium sediminis]
MNARSQHLSAARSRGPSGLEYGVYFTLVFAISLIPAAARMVVPKAGQPRKFFVTDAWARTREVTPMIFSSL